jgi:alanine racemase
MRGEPATLIGIDGEQRITAEDVARRMDTINYEVACGLTPRVPRVYHRDGVVAEPIATGAIAATAGTTTARGATWLPPRHG